MFHCKVGSKEVAIVIFLEAEAMATDWSSWNKRENMSPIDSAHVEEKTSASSASAAVSVTVVHTFYDLFYLIDSIPLFSGYKLTRSKDWDKQKLNGQFEVKAV